LYVDTPIGHLIHGTGRTEFNLAFAGAGTDTQPQILVISGPTFDVSAVAAAAGNHWRFTRDTDYIACESNIYAYTDFLSPNFVYINTPDRANCVDLQRRNGDALYLNCRDNPALYFYPRQIADWHTLENEYSSHVGPRICASTSSLGPLNSPFSIAGVSLRNTIVYILSQAFSTYPGDLPTRVYAGDFDLHNARIISVIEITPPTSRRAPLIAHVYQITTQAVCDGQSTLAYGGTVHRDGPFVFDTFNRGGMDWTIRSSIYAGCLGSQFCF